LLPNKIQINQEIEQKEEKDNEVDYELHSCKGNTATFR
jgi:hypothetical protein